MALVPFFLSIMLCGLIITFVFSRLLVYLDNSRKVQRFLTLLNAYDLCYSENTEIKNDKFFRGNVSRAFEDIHEELKDLMVIHNVYHVFEQTNTRDVTIHLLGVSPKLCKILSKHGVQPDHRRRRNYIITLKYDKYG